MFLDFECDALLFHLHADDDVEIFGFVGSRFVVSVYVEARIVGIFDIVAGMMTVGFGIHARSAEVVVQFIRRIIFSLQIHHWARFAFFVDQKQRRHFGVFGHLGVVCTESRGNMHNTRTIFGGDIVAGNHAESAFCHFHKLVLTVFAHESLLGVCACITMDKFRRIDIQLG